jgi:hypothetical protein
MTQVKMLLPWKDTSILHPGHNLMMILVVGLNTAMNTIRPHSLKDKLPHGQQHYVDAHGYPPW